ncbi:MAG: hypothetical protein II410_01900, partial [Ruminococcus sp.]|nr:hypothetical protein [Ruminococcus sp.]
MTRNLRHDLKRVVAGVCALMLVSGTVPVKPIAEVINTAITASANNPTTDFTFDFNAVTGEVSEADIANISEASLDSVESWLLANATAISQANPSNSGYYYFFYRDNVGGETRLCALRINGTNMASSEELEMYFNSSSEPDIHVFSSDDEENLASSITSEILAGGSKLYFCEAAQEEAEGEDNATTVTWNSSNATYDIMDGILYGFDTSLVAAGFDPQTDINFDTDEEEFTELKVSNNFAVATGVSKVITKIEISGGYISNDFGGDGWSGSWGYNAAKTWTGKA